MTCIRRVALTALILLTSASYAAAQGASTWLLAEGANNATFAQEILVGNPGAQALKVTVTLLPQSDALLTWESRTFDLAGTSRLTVRLGPDFGLNGSASARVTAVLASDNSTPADIVVERTMYFQSVGQQGSHNASGVTQAQLASKWTLAEGSGGMFETFILVGNPNGTPTTVKATYLTGTGGVFETTQTAPANGRVTFYPKGEHAGLMNADFSTEIESLTGGNLVVAERAMYFDGFLSGHDAIGVTSPSTTWLFAEGFTGGNAETAFETYLLLVNTNATPTDATVDFLLDSGEVVSRTYTLAPRQRFNVWVDHEGRTYDARLNGAAFGMRVTSTQPIVAERAMYWGTPSASDPTVPTVPWREGHAAAGVAAGNARWAFAEGQQGRFGAAATGFETFFLLANPTATPITVRATFMREDGKGIVRTVCLAANARTNIWTAVYSELAGRRFATFLESVASADISCPSSAGTPFVAERAVYSGPSFLAGHVNGGTPWTGTIATPPVAPAFAIANVSPSSGRLGGGQTITITGAGFQSGAKVYFDNPAWTGDRNANTHTAAVDQATDVVVSSDGATITAKTPPRGFYTGYQTAGPVTVRVVNPGNESTTLPNGYTFKLNVLAFGDDYVYGSTSGGRAATPFPASLQNRLRAYQKDLLNVSTGAPTGTRVLQFGEYVTVTNAGVVGECASATGGGCLATAGVARFPALADAAASADKYDAVVFVEGVNDIRAGRVAGSVAFAYRDMVARARDRKIVIVMTKFEGNGLGIGGLSDGQLKELGDALWGVTEDTSLNVEIYRQSLFNFETSGSSPTQSGYDRMSQLIFEKVAREFPLQPCDARNDKPGKGCPRNP
ncbi:MAG: IPT/TIG domain-containing protein [Acidobacteria bacterium]|nr:IPT/TIG domain-containing protein [Acidobacteriota bacterium]